MARIKIPHQGDVGKMMMKKGFKKNTSDKSDYKIKLPPKPPKRKDQLEPFYPKMTKDQNLKGKEGLDEEFPISSSSKPTSSVKYKKKDAKVVDLSSSQGPSNLEDDKIPIST
ncbi:hypothetical protein GLYMA_02G175950v4 [Glycine max]|nr:hypothetical protein GLYMA_02G175950v4 [Glycine max]KAH1060836.1 hypothetical protein GYH30_004348 [Glycine max]